MTGLLVQPIIGSMSDRTWNRLGRRRPYFLVGAILASIALFFMPDLLQLSDGCRASTGSSTPAALQARHGTLPRFRCGQAQR